LLQDVRGLTASLDTPRLVRRKSRRGRRRAAVPDVPYTGLIRMVSREAGTG